MLWDGLAWFVAFHQCAWALGAWVLWQQKKHVALERLGGFFLFKASRWTVLGLALLWLLPFPVLCLVEYDSVTQMFQLNPWCLFWLLPMAIMFVFGYWLLIGRPRRRSNRQLAALALALLLIGPSDGATDIEPEFISYGRSDLRVGFRYDPDQLELDRPWVERVNQVFQMTLATLSENQNRRIALYPAQGEPVIVEDLSRADQSTVWGFEGALDDSLDFDNDLRALRSFGHDVLSFGVSPLLISEQQLSDVHWLARLD